MKASIEHRTQSFTVDLSKPLDLSISVDPKAPGINAWYVEDPEITPVTLGEWTGSVAQGADVNFNNIQFNPHAHITHTECLGHITREFYSINEHLNKYFFVSAVISVIPSLMENGDRVITKETIAEKIALFDGEALVIRTLPNSESKKSTRYSNTNPPYLAVEAAEYIKNKGIKHLLIDLPSVDKEKDEGKLLAHNAFWNTANSPRLDATITEFIFVDDHIVDGKYLLNLMVAPFENDATPSKPTLYAML
jgi:kynurenine formamidase